jgi:hypothetical protein
MPKWRKKANEKKGKNLSEKKGKNLNLFAELMPKWRKKANRTNGKNPGRTNGKNPNLFKEWYEGAGIEKSTAYDWWNECKHTSGHTARAVSGTCPFSLKD